MKFKFHTYDVFTTQRFGGNPLAIVEDADGLSTGQMQTIAREFNLSETIFVRKPEDAANTASVRIFLPNSEIPFAGHPTIGCAIHLATRKYKEGCAFETEIRLEEVAGLVPVKVTRIGGAPRAQLTAPVIPFEPDAPAAPLELIASALGLETGDIGFGDHVPRLLQGGPRALHVPIASRDALARARPLEPHWSRLIAPLGTFIAYLYTRGGDNAETHYRARMFAPTSGVVEDPATGGAAVMFAAQLLLSEHLSNGAHRWRLEQGYEMGRPSDIWVEADVAEGKLTAVRVAGQAVQIMSGVLEL